jgi:hypothetical protein
MSQKKFLTNLSILIVLSFLFSGCSLIKGLFQRSSQEKKVEEQGGFSLKDALTLGKSVECTYTTEDGEVTTWVKGNKVRVEGVGMVPTGDKTHKGGMINDGEWIYIWGEEDKTGVKYQISAMETKKWEEDVEDLKDPEKWATEAEEKYKVECKQTVVSDSKFTPPSGIEFQNLTEMFEKMEELPKELPSVSPGPGLTEKQMEQLQDLMKGFGQE